MNHRKLDVSPSILFSKRFDQNGHRWFSENGQGVGSKRMVKALEREDLSGTECLKFSSRFFTPRRQNSRMGQWGVKLDTHQASFEEGRRA